MTITIYYSKVGTVDITQLDASFKNASIPIDGLGWLASLEQVKVDYADAATPTQQSQGEALVAAHESTLDARNAVLASAVGAASAIPNWAHWTQEETETWYEANIHQPLVTGRANVPATLTFTSTRAVIMGLITIMDQMAVMLWALARMVIALRNRTWPHLQN